MSFKQYLRDEVTKGLDETYKADAAWAKNHPGRGYYDATCPRSRTTRWRRRCSVATSARAA